MRMTVSREHTPLARGAGKPGFPTPPPAGGPGPHAGVGGNLVSPYPTRWESLGGRSPPRKNLMFILFVCGGAVWAANVTMGEPGSPIPPPGLGRAQPLRRGMGKPGFPTPPSGGRVWEGYALKRGDGEPGFPHPPARGKVRAQPLRRRMGKPGFPILPTRWEGLRGAAFAQRDGETGFPHTPHPVGGSGRAAPSQEVWSSPHHGAAMLRRVIMQPLCRMRRRSPVRHREEHP